MPGIGHRFRWQCPNNDCGEGIFSLGTYILVVGISIQNKETNKKQDGMLDGEGCHIESKAPRLCLWKGCSSPWTSQGGTCFRGHLSENLRK